MRIERIIYTLLILTTSLFAALNWRKASLFQADNDALRAKVEALEAEADQASQAANLLKASGEKVRAQTTELVKLRNEVTQLRSTAKTLETLTAENQKLRSEAQQLRGTQPTGAPSQQTAGNDLAGHDQFPRNSWNFAGYASPEAALVSAIWAMREGDPKTYMASLAPEEQQRVTQSWQNKTEAEVAEKHKSDVSSISGMRVLEKQNLGPTEVLMNVYLEGVDRVERIRMNQVGQEWKFGGFIRDQQPNPSSAPNPQK